MKTFRMIGMALFAVLMCVNFAACSGDDDEPGEGGNTPEVSKKLMEISAVTDDGDDWSYQFTYDGDRLSSCKYDGTSYTYSWGNDLIIEKDKWDSTTFTLTDGMISKMRSIVLTYNSSKQLISQDYSSDANINYTWANGRLTKIVETDPNGKLYETIEFTYGNETCKGFFPLINDYTDVDEYLAFAHPELAGIRTSYLPTKMVQIQYDDKTTYEFSYTFDNEGYLKTCTVKYITDYDSESTIYSFKWE